MKDKLSNILIEYGKNGRYPFHMPGHKRNKKILDEMDPFDVDITEIEGFDNLHHPGGIIKEAMENAREFYGTRKTWFLVNGSTCGLLAAITATTNIGDKILIGRNCHKAVYHGALLRNLKVEYIYPEYIPEYGIHGGYSPQQIEKKLSENPSIKAVVLTSPTYDGVVSDIKKIAEIVHDHGGILIVDEAHGAHFCLFENGIKPAYHYGADLVIESLHKTLPALTQSGVLHLQGERIETWKIDKALEVFETSSPSYLLMASMDDCIKTIQSSGKEQMNNLLKNLESFKEKVGTLQTIQIPGKDLIGKNEVFAYDETKLIFSVLNASISGKELAEILRRDYGFEMEMETPTYALALCSICDSKEAIDELAKALEQIDQRLGEIVPEGVKFSYKENEIVMSMYEASVCETESVLLENSVGEVSTEFMYFYPPGIPLIVPGEVISEAVLQQIVDADKKRIIVNGLSDFSNQTIQIIKRDKGNV